MPTSFKDLELSRSQYLILKRISFMKRIKCSTVDSSSKYNFLIRYSLIDYSDQTHLYYSLSDKAKFLLRYRRKERFRFWLPVIISIVALLAGYDIYTNSLLEELLQTIASLWKTIMENLDAFFQKLF